AVVRDPAEGLRAQPRRRRAAAAGTDMNRILYLVLCVLACVTPLPVAVFFDNLLNDVAVASLGLLVVQVLTYPAGAVGTVLWLVLVLTGLTTPTEGSALLAPVFAGAGSVQGGGWLPRGYGRDRGGSAPPCGCAGAAPAARGGGGGGGAPPRRRGRAGGGGGGGGGRLHDSERLRLAETPPHPVAFAHARRPTSPRTRGEVKVGDSDDEPTDSKSVAPGVRISLKPDRNPARYWVGHPDHWGVPPCVPVVSPCLPHCFSSRLPSSLPPPR